LVVVDGEANAGNDVAVIGTARRPVAQSCAHDETGAGASVVRRDDRAYFVTRIETR
jgi:hypothetical protein